MVDEEYKKQLEGKSYAGYNKLLVKGRENLKHISKKAENLGKSINISAPKKAKGNLGIKPLNPKKAILQGTGNLRLVKEVENTYANPIQDNRSLYFKDDFIKEREKDKKWLLS